MSTEPKEELREKAEKPIESGPESKFEFYMTGCVEPDKLDDNQKMGDPLKQVTEEDCDRADAKRMEAMSQLSERNIEKALELFTESIEINPNSSLLFVKRGQVYLKLTKPNACIRDCTRALELNCDSAATYRLRARAYRLLGEGELIAKDLRQASKIDFAERVQSIHKAKEARARAASRDIDKLLQDPEIMTAFQDPEVAEALQDISKNPANFVKYQSNPKIMALVTKLSSIFSRSGINFPGFPGTGASAGAGPGFMGFTGGFPEAGGNPTQPLPTKPSDDDNLD